MLKLEIRVYEGDFGFRSTSNHTFKFQTMQIFISPLGRSNIALSVCLSIPLSDPMGYGSIRILSDRMGIRLTADSSILNAVGCLLRCKSHIALLASSKAGFSWDVAL